MSKGEVPTYELSTIEDIESIPDYETAKKYMKKWKIRTKGIKSKEGAILKLTEFWRARELASVFEEEESRNRSKIKKNKDTVGKRTEAVHEVPIEIRDGDGKLPLLPKKAQDVHQMAEESRNRSEIQNNKDSVGKRTEAVHEVPIEITDCDGKLPLLQKKAQDVHQIEERSGNRSDIQKIKDNVEGTKDALHEVLIRIRDRDGQLPLLQRKAADVHRMSKRFKRISFKARAKRCLCQEKSVIIITVFVILVIIAVVVTTTIIILEKGRYALDMRLFTEH